MQIATLVRVALYGASAAATMISPARAEEAKESAGNKGIEEVIITARRTEESQQSVPVSVTALSAENLEQQVVLDVSDLQTNVSGLVISPNTQGGAPTFAVRAAKEDNGTSAKVAIYIDDVPVNSTLSAAKMMYDLSSVEVLKGPQGTLFGANSTGGAVIMRPNKPSDKFEGYVEVGAGNYDRREVQGMVNIPISDAVALRIAGESVDRDGFIKNIGTHTASPSRLSNEDYYSGRVSLRIEPTENFRNDIVFDYFKKDQQPRQPINVKYTGPMATGVLIDPDRRTVNLDGANSGTTNPANVGCATNGTCAPTWDKAETWGVYHTATVDLNDALSLKNTISYREDSLDTFENSGAVQYAIRNGRTAQDLEQLTEELSFHLTSMDDRLRTQGGMFYSKQEADTGNSYNLFWLPGVTPAVVGALPPGALPVPVTSINFYNREFEQKALYGQSSFDLTPDLTVTLGLRYSWDEGDYTIQPRFTSGTGGNPFGGVATPYANGTGGYPVLFSTGSFFLGGMGACNIASMNSYKDPDPANCKAHQDLESSASSYNVTLEYRVGDKGLVYAAARGGYIRGGFNNNTPVQADQTFGPEKLRDFEFGFKADWELLDRPIRTNVAAFHGNYRGLQSSQVSSYEPTPGAAPVSYIFVDNAGSSSYYGFDTEIKYDAAEWLGVGLNYTYLHAEFDNFCGPLPARGQGCIDLQGKTPGQTPENTLNMFATVYWPLNSSLGSLSSTVTYFWRDDTTARDVPTINIVTGEDFTEFDQMPSFSLVNFTTGWDNILGSNFGANVWVKNVFDEDYIIYNDNALFLTGNASRQLGDPRTYGVTVRYAF